MSTPRRTLGRGPVEPPLTADPVHRAGTAAERAAELAAVGIDHQAVEDDHPHPAARRALGAGRPQPGADI